MKNKAVSRAMREKAEAALTGNFFKMASKKIEDR